MSDKWIVCFATRSYGGTQCDRVHTTNMHPVLFFSDSNNYGGARFRLVRIYSAIRVPDELAHLPDLDEEAEDLLGS